MKLKLIHTFLIVFGMLGLIEALFIGILCEDISRADWSARREFKIVKASQHISQCIKLFEEAQSNAWNTDPVSLAKRPGLRRNLDQLLADTSRELAEAGESTATMLRVKNDVDELLNKISARQGLRYKTSAGVTEYIETGLRCGSSFIRAMRKTNKLVSKYSAEKPLFGVSPTHLLYGAAGVNVLYMLFVIVFLHVLITAPVGRLARGCRNITKGEPLEKSPVIGRELSALQDSFYEMSRQIIENEKGRKSYVALLQTVQLAAISRVREQLAGFADTSGLAERAKKKLQAAGANLSSLVTLIQSMTEVLASSTRQSYTINMSSCSTKKLLEEMQANVEALLQEKKIDLCLEGNDYQVEADPALIKRVLLNLVSNAIKYSPAGSHVTVSVSSADSSVQFDVKDNGPGISSDGIERLFQRYSQLSALDGIKRAGTGLGLAICKELVEAHNGSIGCTSTPGSGSVFWFRLPLTASKPAALSETGVDGTGIRTGKEAKTVPPGKAAKASPDKMKSGSLVALLAFILVGFLAIQTLVFFQLNSMLNDLTIKGQKYTAQRELLLTTQELFARQKLWGGKMEAAAMRHDMNGIRMAVPFLDNLRKDMSKLYSHVDKAQQPPQIDVIIKGQTELLRQTYYGITHIAEIAANIDETQRQIEDGASTVEHAFYQLFDLQALGFNESYDWSNQLRSGMITTLQLAGAAELAVIVAALWAGINIARRINVLKTKAEDFADGKQIAPGLSGRDELTYLDGCLCSVSDEIRSAEAQRKELMSVINHDLRTPLASVLSVLESLSEGVYGALPEQGLRIVTQSDRELQKLLLQINDLLTLEKIDSGAYDLSPESLKVSELLNESVASVTEAAGYKDIAISVSTTPELSALNLRGDRQLLIRLCSVVLKNSIENSQSHSSLNLKVKQTGSRITFDIEDCGTGINPSLLPVIFQRFRFVDGKPISGLGLALAYRVCRMHEGEIQIKQSSPAGTIVGISLPIAA